MTTLTGVSLTATAQTILSGKKRRVRRRRLVIASLIALMTAIFCVSLMCGHTFYTPEEVWRVVLGENIPGASFTVGTLRLPRAALALLVGLSFGFAGVAFQTMLRNPLASPDIIGISSGATAAAVFAIVALSLGATAVSIFAVAAGLGVALLVYLLSYKNGAASARLILIGIGIASMLNSVTSYLLTQASEWDLQEVMRWMTGSLNGTVWKTVLPVLGSQLVFVPLLLSQSKNLSMTQLGDDTAAALGVRVNRTRLIVTLASVGLIAFAAAASGPIAFVAFLSGPIAARIVGAGGSLFLPSALMGALLVLTADFSGQFLLGVRYPVGVITGILGAPYLVWLIVRTNRRGGFL
ncbi:MAG: iron chelate uptake ABC transporter family permease subunit [Clostridiales Family XIII bacterium]|jgi:iron complex transport system permease protein|nr:iron chelate uptake ABC transporter family permease subunit [Clostridiales Family XIII bacterium]